eukprot:10854238-Heterocapsa_arctica.AAC.1
MIEVSPKMIQSLIVQAHHVKLEQKAAINLGVSTFDSDRVVLQPIVRILNSKKMLCCRASVDWFQTEGSWIPGGWNLPTLP